MYTLHVYPHARTKEINKKYYDSWRAWQHPTIAKLGVSDWL